MRIITASLLLLFLTSCKNTEQTQTVETVHAETAAVSLASNEARIVAKIVSIDASRDIAGVCADAPCRTTISVESIISQGKLFQPAESQTINHVFFAFTLSPANEKLFPGIKTTYPGLKINDRFEATIQSRPSTVGNGFSYTIYDYKKLNPNQKPYHIEK